MTPKPSKEAMEAAEECVNAWGATSAEARGVSLFTPIIDRALSARESRMEALAKRLHEALRREASTIGGECTLCGGRTNREFTEAESHDPQCPARPWTELIEAGE